MALVWLAQQLAPQWHALPQTTWVAAGLGLVCSYMARAGRLHVEWAPVAKVSWLECFHVSVSHIAAVSVLPMRSGELGFPWLLHSRWCVSAGDAMRSLIWLRAQDAVLLCSVVVAAVAAAWLVPDVAAPTLAAVLLGALLLTALVMSQLGRWLCQAALQRWPHATPQGVPANARHDGTALSWRQRMHGWPHHWRGFRARLFAVGAAARPALWGWAALNWAMKLTVFAALLAALADVDALTAMAGTLAGESAAAIPLQAPAGLGTYEAAVWFGVRAVSAADSMRVLLAALILHVFAICTSLLTATLSALTLGSVLISPRERDETLATRGSA